MKSIACVITCKGRLHHVQQTLPLIVALGTSELIVVDYGCPDRTGDWVEANHPGVTVVRVDDDPGFWLARARNIGASHATADWLLFIDADIMVDARWYSWMQEHLQSGNFYRRALVVGIRDADTHGTVICARADFDAVGGYDEVYRGWGGEDEDIYPRLNVMGVAEQTFPASLAQAIKHGDEERAGWAGLGSKQDFIDVITCYRLAKLETLKALGLTGELPLELRTQFMENTKRELMKWFAVQRAYPLNLKYELKVQGRTIEINIDLPY